MPVRVTPEAVAVVRRSLELAGLDPGAVGVRLREAGGGVQPRFVPSPQPGDEVVEAEGVRIFVDRRIVERHPVVVVGVSQEHERLVLLPGAG